MTDTKQVKSRIAHAAAQLALEGDTDQAAHILELLGTFDNVMRQPGEVGQPGFGRGWGFGDPYEEFGYGMPTPARNIPNTGDLPTSFDQKITEDDEPMPGMEYEDDEDVELGPDEHGIATYDELAAYGDEDDKLDLDMMYASVLEKVRSKLGQAGVTEFTSILGTTAPFELTAQEDEEEEVEDDVEEVAEEAQEDAEEALEEAAPEPEKKTRKRRESIEVWKADLIPDIAPIIRRILKHVSVQYSIPFSTLTDTLRDAKSPIAGLLADALDKLSI
jgi:hypothetical protein